MAPSEPNAIPFRAKGEIPVFAEEKEGWEGYIEWEKYPEKKAQVEALLKQYDFPDVRLDPYESHAPELTAPQSPPSSRWCPCPRPTPSSPASDGSSTTRPSASTTLSTRAGASCKRKSPWT